MFDIVIPVYNEVDVIDTAVNHLRTVLGRSLDDYTIRIVDNQSDDETYRHARRLQERFDEIRAMRIPRQGKARAIRAGWEASDADILGFVDVDLSPDIRAIPRIVRRVRDTRGLAVSSRHLASSETERSWYRQGISHAYNRLLWLITGSAVSDHQCGLKVVHRDFWDRISSSIRSTEWFLDTELVLHANRLGVPIDEFAVSWEAGPTSGVNTVSVSWKMLVSLYRFWERYGFQRESWSIRQHPR